MLWKVGNVVAAINTFSPVFSFFSVEVKMI